MLECWPAPSRPRSGTGWRFWGGGGSLTRRPPGRRYTPGADTWSPQQVSVSDKSYHVYRLQMVQTVNAKNLLDKNLMMYCLPPTPQYIQSSENRSHSLFSESYFFRRASHSWCWQVRWGRGLQLPVQGWLLWQSGLQSGMSTMRSYSDLTRVCKQVASHWQWNSLLFVACLLKVDELFLIFVSSLRGSPLF